MDKREFEQKWGKEISAVLGMHRCPNCLEGIFEPCMNLTEAEDVMECSFCGYSKPLKEYNSDLKKLKR